MSRFQEYFKTPTPLQPQLFTPLSCHQDQSHNLFADHELHPFKLLEGKASDQFYQSPFSSVVPKKSPIVSIPLPNNCYLINEKLEFGDDSQQQIRTPRKKNEKNGMLETTANKKYELRPSGSALPHGIDAKEAERTLRVLTSQAYNVVCEKGATTYKLVSEEIINNTADPPSIKEQKNIKRRVYDALNVLIALGKLEKRGRKIMPKKDFEKEKIMRQRFFQLRRLANEKEKLLKSKKYFYKNLNKKNACLKKLIQRNSLNNNPQEISERISMPFFILNYDNVKVSQEGQTKVKILLNSDQNKNLYGQLNALTLLKFKGK